MRPAVAGYGATQTRSCVASPVIVTSIVTSGRPTVGEDARSVYSPATSVSAVKLGPEVEYADLIGASVGSRSR